MATKIKHGLSKHPLYRVWIKIKERVYNKNHESYKHYGGNGVIMCDEWKRNFVSFYEWAIVNGWKPGLNVDKDKIPFQLGIEAKIYSPEMCSILTTKENNRYTKYNTWFEYNGKKQTLQDWSIELKIDQATLHHRVFDFGYSFEEAVTIPIGYRKNIRRFEYNGQRKTIHEWERFYGLKRNRLAYWVDKKGLTFRESLLKNGVI